MKIKLKISSIRWIIYVLIKGRFKNIKTIRENSYTHKYRINPNAYVDDDSMVNTGDKVSNEEQKERDELLKKWEEDMYNKEFGF